MAALSIFDKLGANTLFLIMGISICVLAVASIVILVLLIVTMVRLKKMRRNYRIFMNGRTAENLEDSMLDHFAKINEITDKHTSQITKINEDMQTVYTKLGVVKYDAFNEMGGKLSFALAMLDNSNNGYIINAMHSREGCYTYVKEIIKGESFITLGDEERQALSQAMGTDV